jgi:hypothetical protein
MSGDKAQKTQEQNRKLRSRLVLAGLGPSCGAKQSFRIKRRGRPILSNEYALTLAYRTRETLANRFSGAYRG